MRLSSPLSLLSSLLLFHPHASHASVLGLGSLPWSILDPYRDLLQLLLDTDGALVNGPLGALAGLAGVEATYDYVVVGGGTAGNALGTRLAQGGHSVAIVEAGAFQEIAKPVLGTTPLGDIVGIGASILDSDPLVDWEFVTQPQAGAAGREIHYAQGKGLGGSSNLNFMIYQRGTRESFAQWATLVNDSSYTFDKVLPYFQKAMTFTPPNTNARLANATTAYDAGAFGNSNGPLQVGYTNYVSVFSTIMSKALQSVGLGETGGQKSGTLIGSSYCSSTIRSSDQTRGTSSAYIRQAEAVGIDSLKVYLLTLANRILFDANKTATGVEVQTAGVTYTLRATKEVVVSAGAFHSPQLLMVSGVGPADTLTALDIPLVAALPGVGQNMWDHILFGPSYDMKIDTLSHVLKDPAVLVEELARYAVNAEGVFTSPVVDFIGWEKVPGALRQNFSPSTVQDLAGFPADWPEVELISGQGFIGNFTFPVVDQLLNGNLEQQFATILGALVAPTSRGNVTIQSRSTAHLPLINPNWLTTTTDQEVAVALYRRIRQIFATPALASVTNAEFFPGPAHQTDAELLAVIQGSLQTVWHAACTCKMGTADDPMVVLDSQARVQGVQGLRVVDASAFPLLPPGHPQSAVYMLAEKIADQMLAGSPARK